MSALITSLNLRRTPPTLPSRFVNYQTKTRLRLPFDGELAGLLGSRSVAENAHAIYPDRQFHEHYTGDQFVPRGEPTRGQLIRSR